MINIIKMKRNLVLLIIPIIFLASHSGKSKKNNQKKPNVIFISIDDLNDWISPLNGHSQAITPNLDKLCQQGLLFTNAHCSQAVCTASRNSLLSGIHPTTSGWYASTEDMRLNYDSVMADHMMLPEYFKANGYNTYATGKVFHNGISDHPDHTDDYWTEYSPSFWSNMEPNIKKAGFGYRGAMFFPFPKDGGQLVQLYGEDTINNYYKNKNRFYSLCGGPLAPEDIPEKGMYDEQIANWAINKLNERQDKPFFMAVGFIRPHVPYTAPQKYFDLYNIDSLEIPAVPDNEFEDIPMMGKSIAYGPSPRGDWFEVTQKKEILPELVQAYLACVTFADDQIGKVLEALENSPYSNNTIVVLFSDHGQHLGEKRHFRKQALWEEATQMPLIIKIPGQASKGKQCTKAVSLLDLYPTLVDLCNLPKDKKLEGNSLVPLIDNPNESWDKPVLSTWYYKNHAIRSNNWRYILYRDGGEELYDEINDPGEHVNLAKDPKYADIIMMHKKYLPKTDALPVGKTKWEGDNLDRQIERWIKNDSIPMWLR
jgi:arylsulfatase A-like enzyme